MSIIKDEDLRNKAWQEVVDSGEEISASLVFAYAQKYWVLENEPELYEFVIKGIVTAPQMYNVCKKLQTLPPYYRGIVLAYPTLTSSSLAALRRFEYEFRDEFDEIIATGFLSNGRDNIPLGEVTERDINGYGRKLAWEAKQANIIEATDKQTKQSGLLILDGIDIPEQLAEHKDKRTMAYLFPEGAYTPSQVAKMLERNAYDILFIGAYTKQEPDIRFDPTRVIKPSSINGVKPQYLIDAFKKTLIS